VLNNKTANINSGKSIPVSSVSLNSGGIVDPGNGGVSNTFTQVQYRDTGITLDVTPRVNPGGLVYMEIKQEKSEPGAASAGVNGNPPVDKSTIQTEIAVQSGETVVLAGLIEESDTVSKGGVPGLMNIPVLGRFFGTTVKTKRRQEILVLIKPTVIDSADSARAVTDDYKTQFKGLKPLLKKLNKTP
jgi:general secretion pathway protein D